MKEPQDDHSSTRPISVAELLAKNGTIGAPPVGGRRRRRRGNADSVTVAELTGEIPILTGDVEPPAAAHDVADDVVEVAEVAEVEELSEVTVDEVPDEPEEEAPVASAASNGVVEHAPVQAPSEAEAEYAAHLEQRDADPEPIDFAPPPRRAHIAPRTGFSAPTGGAEQMSPDPLVDDDDDDDLALLDIDDVDDVPPTPYEAEDAPSYRRSSADTLFGGGQSVADDLARRGRQPGPEDIDLGDEDVKPADVAPREVAEERGSSFLRGVWVVAQCILAVAFGAGLFIAFDQLWKWNSIVALVLGVLVILGLVVGVRVVRKTEDIGSTLIAVAVGAMVTFGPLALLQAH
jgi:hypothetical protein